MYLVNHLVKTLRFLQILLENPVLMLGNLLILLFNIYMVEIIPNNLQNQKIFHLIDKQSLHNMAGSSVLRSFFFNFYRDFMKASVKTLLETMFSKGLGKKHHKT